MLAQRKTHTESSSPEKYEIQKFLVITVSALSLVLAGIFSSRATWADVPPSFEPSVTVRARPRVENPVVAREIRFVEREILQYSRLAGVLTERLKTEANAAQLTKMRRALAQLESQIQEIRQAERELHQASATNRKFLRETLRGSVLALQETGQKTVSVFIDADIDADKFQPDPGLVAKIERSRDPREPLANR